MSGANYPAMASSNCSRDHPASPAGIAVFQPGSPQITLHGSREPDPVLRTPQTVGFSDDVVRAPAGARRKTMKPRRASAHQGFRPSTSSRSVPINQRPLLRPPRFSGFPRQSGILSGSSNHVSSVVGTA